MKIKEFRDLSVNDLQNRRRELRQEGFNLRMQQSGGQLEKPHLLRTNRRLIAKIQTVLAEKRIEAQAQNQGQPLSNS